MLNALTALNSTRGEATLAITGGAGAAGLHRAAGGARTAATVHVWGGSRALGAVGLVDGLRWGVWPSADVVLQEVINLHAVIARGPIRCVS